MTTHSWDENPKGTWKLEIENVAGASDYGKSTLFQMVCMLAFRIVCNVKSCLSKKQ